MGASVQVKKGHGEKKKNKLIWISENYQPLHSAESTNM